MGMKQFFLRWVLGLVGLNDAKGIDVANVYGREAVRQKPKGRPVGMCNSVR